MQTPHTDGASRRSPLTYPPTRRSDQADDYHGTVVPDPYRWLEDPDSAESRAWIEAQNRITQEYLESIPGRNAISRRLTRLWDYERYGVPVREGGFYFYFKNDGLQNQSVLYVQPSLESQARELLDPNQFSDDGTVALTSISVSHDGELLAYGISSGGSDWQELRLREVRSGKDREDRLRWIKFSGVSWTKDGKGFFYSRYPEPDGGTLTTANVGQKLYYHRIGDPQDQDRIVYERPDQPKWGFDAEVTKDGRYLVVNVWEGTDRRNRIFYLDLGDPLEPRLDGMMTRLLDEFDARYKFIGNDDGLFYIQTDLDASRGRLVAIDLRRPQRESWLTIIPECTDTLQETVFAGGKFVTNYLHDAYSRIRVCGRDGQLLNDIVLPSLGTVTGMGGEPDTDEIFYAFTSFLYPTTIFRHVLTTSSTEIFRAPSIEFDSGPYLTEQIFFNSADGTRIPAFVTRRRDMAFDGTHPTLLYAYGGFNNAVTPTFSVSRLIWLEMGGVYVVACVRGGSEYGEDWHQAGMLERKQNVFDDFIAAAEHLIAQGYTSPSKLSIQGGSNGGLLVGVALNRRPELFAVALPAVGVMDMLRYHRFTIGWAWVPEYGSSEIPDHFHFLHAYSPLHNLREGTCYPATLITTADHDDRVVPAHSFKYAAALQAAQGCNRPTLIRIETRAGHGAGKPTSKLIEEQTDVMAFLAKELRMALPELGTT